MIHAPKPLTIMLGKSVRWAAKLRGGGSALPGLFVETVDKTFVPDTLDQLPKGVILVSGTNGKTTTTKMIVKLLEDQGLKVFTNRTGSNFVRGVAAALLESIDTKGNLEADIAVLELDEAHAVHFVKVVKPRHALLLNVMRDQLDRFGEIDTTAKMLQAVANATSETVVINREDKLLRRIGAELDQKQVHYFGLDKTLLSVFPNDDELYDTDKKSTDKKPQADVTLKAFSDQKATFAIDDKIVSVPMSISGIYNIFNAGAAITLVKSVLNDSLDEKKLIASLSSITPAFGRGEKFMVGNQPLELVLVKNPSGFRLALRSFSPKDHATLIAINDQYADGRDMSWLWDVDFASLRGGIVEVTGIRAYDMALRLQYDEIDVHEADTAIVSSLRSFIANNTNQPKRIYATYTAMLKIRRELAKITKVDTI